MTIELDPIYIGNSQLFYTDVYDIDGVTKLTPLSCVCSVFNQSTNAAIVTDQAGTVGLGFAQYNWAGTATAGRYEAVLTATVSANVVKSEHFIIDVRAKPPVITVLPSSIIGKVRRMTNEKFNTSYTDAEIQTIIETYPLVDGEGFAPDQDNWTPTYDLNAAAATIWEEKASGRTQNFDFSADGGSYSRSQSYEMAMKQARYFRSKRGMKTMEMESTPKKDDDVTDDE